MDGWLLAWLCNFWDKHRNIFPQNGWTGRFLMGVHRECTVLSHNLKQKSNREGEQGCCCRFCASKVQENAKSALRSAAALPVSSGSTQCLTLISHQSAGLHLRAELTKMINSLNSHLTHRNSSGHGTLLTLLSPCLPLPLRLSNTKFIAQCLNRCINITNGLLRAWNYLWTMN